MKIEIKWNKEGITRIMEEQKAHTYNIIGKDNNLLGINFQFYNFFLNAFIYSYWILKEMLEKHADVIYQQVLVKMYKRSVEITLYK
jgi:hypothetical protein